MYLDIFTVIFFVSVIFFQTNTAIVSEIGKTDFQCFPGKWDMHKLEIFPSQPFIWQKFINKYWDWDLENALGASIL